MTAPALFSGHFFSALGWALFHFLWQGALVAGIVLGLDYLLAKRPPAVRCAFACAARSDGRRARQHANPRARLDKSFSTISIAAPCSSSEAQHLFLWPASCSTSFFQIFLVEDLQ
jgi:hypothetical protein